MKKLTVAIDGPAGAGKSSVAKLVASQLHYLYIDTGAMYRAVAWLTGEKGIAADDETAIRQLTDTMQIRMQAAAQGCRIWINEREVTEEIRSPEVSARVSAIAALPAVRYKLVQLQRQLAQPGGVILDGRDIGTVVLPHADIKFFLTASVQARARRRFLEMQEKGMPTTLAQVEENIASRDYQDSHREHSPLRQASDAVFIDNSEWNLQETAGYIQRYIEEKQG